MSQSGIVSQQKKDTIGASVYVGGLPGTGKSTMGLSFPGVEQHVCGEGEEQTAKNFKGRTDILPPHFIKWQDYLADEDFKRIAEEKVTENQIEAINNKAKFRCVSDYRKHLFKMYSELRAGSRQELQTVFLDNFSPFADLFKAYTLIKYESDIYSKEGNFDGRKFYPKYADELEDTIRMLISMTAFDKKRFPNARNINVVVASHIQLSLDEEDSRKAMDPTAAKLPREWLPKVDGKIRFGLGGLFTYCFYLHCVENPGQAVKYYAKAVADESNVGLAKCRIQPFPKPQRIEVTKNKFYDQLITAMNNHE